MIDIPFLPHSSEPVTGKDDEGRMSRIWSQKFFDIIVALRSRVPRTGTKAFAAATSAAVTLSPAEPTANYNVHIDAPEDQRCWVTAKTTSGFTINVSSSSSATFGWTLVRL